MSRTIRNKNLEKPDSRKALPISPKPHWHLLDTGLHLGYRRRKTGGTWIARRFTEAGTYLESKLGLADDANYASDGDKVLNFSQAQGKARKWYESEARREAGLEPVRSGQYTVRDVVTDYLTHYEREGKGYKTTKASADAHILPALGDVVADRLTTKRIADWHNALAKAPARLRTSKAAPDRNTRTVSTDTDAVRRRRATANRVLTVLKAALNHAWREGRIATDAAWRKARPFRNVSSPVVRYLIADECNRLINACPDDLRRIVQGAIMTGCRYGELGKLKVADFNPDAGTVTVRTSKGGNTRHVVLTDEGRQFFTSVTVGKTSNALIFTHDNGEAWGKSHQSRPLATACGNAAITPAVSFHVLRHTHGSLLAMQGVPMPVIAKQLGHADTRMTEKHYAHLSPSYVSDTIRQNFPKLGMMQESKVVKLRG